MKIGLVLAGGLAKGAFQSGFLKALKEELGDGNEIVAISCASIGMLSAYAYATDKVELLEEMWRNVHFDSTVDIIYKVWHNNFLKQIIFELSDEKDVLKMPIYAPVMMFPLIHASWSKMEGNYHAKWRKFMLGGVSFPLLSGGIHFWRGQIAIDGSGMDNIPLLPLLYHEKCDLILVCHFYAEYRPRKEYLQFGVPVIDYDISIESAYRNHSFDFHSDVLTARVNDGYAYGKKICSELFAGGANDLPALLAVAERHRQAELKARMDKFNAENWIQTLNNVLHPLLFSHKQVKIHTFSYPQPKKKKEERTKETERSADVSLELAPTTRRS